jgi:hypothetical protein
MNTGFIVDTPLHYLRLEYCLLQYSTFIIIFTDLNSAGNGPMYAVIVYRTGTSFVPEFHTGTY